MYVNLTRSYSELFALLSVALVMFILFGYVFEKINLKNVFLSLQHRLSFVYSVCVNNCLSNTSVDLTMYRYSECSTK